MSHAENSTESQAVAARLRAALQAGDLAAFGDMLDENVRWGGETDTPETCHTRAQVLERLTSQHAAGMQTHLIEVVPGPDAVLVALNVRRPVTGGFARERTVYQVLKIRNQHVVDIRGYGSRGEAAAQAGITAGDELAVQGRQVVPILNVSNLLDSFAWFAKLGWTRKWDWSESSGPATFGAVASADCEIFLCLNGQGGRGQGRGVWLSIWVDDVDALRATCERDGIEILRPPRDEAWGVREMHIRHPDGHVFRISQPVHGH
jgi:catechol 2,3-dioxygenase-like lactoylglutathione lyase family enzyme/ketosteroid isomerase-like protein